MPRYDYFCEENDRTIELIHPISEVVSNWGELCRVAKINVGTAASDAPVRKVFNTPPMANTPLDDADLKNHGWTKFVKRSDGTYENVTRTGTEKRFLDPKDPTSLPHIHKKVTD